VTQHSRRARRSRQSLRLWTYDQLQAAAPYVSSILRSLTEHAHAVQRLRGRKEEIDNRPGRADRKALIDLQEIAGDLAKAEEQYGDASEELEGLGLSPFNSIGGTALAPFMHSDQLAWFVFDLNGSPPIRAWRYQSDPDDTRRKLTYAQMH